MIHGDRVQETTTTTGTGDLTLGGATTDHLSFSAEIGEGETVAYLIEVDGGGWEIAEGSLSGSTLTRTTLKSSDSDSPIDLPSGTHTVSQILTAARVDSKAETFSDLGIPENGYLVLATQSQSVADNNPTVGGVEVVWLIVDQTSAPASPTGLSVIGSDGEASLSWTASSGADGHRVYRNTTNDFSTASHVGSDLGASANSYTDTTVSNGTEYWYWVTAFNSIGESSASTPDSATPSAANPYSTDFSEYTTGSAPSDWDVIQDGTDWTVTVEDLGARRVLSMSPGGSSTAVKALAPNSAVVSGDIETLTEAWHGAENVNAARAIIRSDGLAIGDGYLLELDSFNDEISLRMFNGGSVSDIENVPFTVNTQTYYRIRFRAIGTSIKAKVWDASGSEPTTGGPDDDGFQISVTDSTLSSGRFGFAAFGTTDIRHAFVTAAFNGNTAPEPS